MYRCRVLTATVSNQTTVHCAGFGHAVVRASYWMERGAPVSVSIT